MLAAWGIGEDGRKVLLHLMAGSKEDTETVRAFFQDMRARGLGDPLLVVSDGAPGSSVRSRSAFPARRGNGVVIMAATKAAALGLTPMARVVGQATSGLAPKLVMMTPVEAVRKVASKVGWDLKDVDLFEINEAFSVQAVAVTRELGIDLARVNIHGGAVALGHAIGASGARVLTTLLYALKRKGLKRGIAALCLGGGNGVALAVERHLTRAID